MLGSGLWYLTDNKEEEWERKNDNDAEEEEEEEEPSPAGGIIVCFEWHWREYRQWLADLNETGQGCCHAPTR